MEINDFQRLLRERVLVLDGAMGTMIQRRALTSVDFRGERFKDHPVSLEGCNDILCLTRPDVIESIHKEYLDAGADIISTDTFNANAISLSDYGLEKIPGLIREINREGARLAVKAASNAAERAWGARAMVAGSVGPTNKAATMSPDVSDPAGRNVNYDELFGAYLEQCEGLIEGEADLILFETVFDTLNLKAGLDAAHKAMEESGIYLPIMISVTVSDRSMRTLSGQTLQAFATSVEEYDCVVSLGINCSFGPKDIIPAVRELGKSTSRFISTHPNAGLPDALGEYVLSPEDFVTELRPLLSDRLVNIVGGCCGTSPMHIGALRRAVDNSCPYLPASLCPALRISGLERVVVRPENNLLVVGERCNVAGSRKFLRLIKEHNYDEALLIAARQVEDGAMVIDINMDDPLIDARKEMIHFLRLYASDPEVAKVPVMIDSSDWNVVEAALKNLQGKSIVNSISLKEGEEVFLKKASKIRRLGAAVIVMAFDETGQADTFERKIEVCRRAYRLLTEKCGFKGEDIIFDVNVMAVATGLEQHARYGIDFIEAVRWIKENLPGALTSGGISNLSFAFRGKNTLREAMHTVFLYHAIAAGLDMAIMNPASSIAYDDVDPRLRDLLEDVILARRPEASDELAEYAASDASSDGSGKVNDGHQRDLSVPVGNRLEDALMSGRSDYLAADIDELLLRMKGVDIVEGPLMAGMKRVGVMFGEGKMFLPQVVKTARVMKQAVDYLKPHLISESRDKETIKAGKVLLATVKGDVHDIGKNIVSIVLSCNNYEILDLGVMVPAEDIVRAALEFRPDIICLSGLITPSLAEMRITAEALAQAGIEVPILVGGATTSALHTALKLAPAYRGPVVHMKDASQNPVVAAALMNSEGNRAFIADLMEAQEKLRAAYETQHAEKVTYEEAKARGRESRPRLIGSPAPAVEVGKIVKCKFSIAQLLPFINWKMFLHAWGVHDKKCPCGCESREDTGRLMKEAEECLQLLDRSGRFDGFGIVRIMEASAEGDDLIIGNVRIPVLRQQHAGSGYRSIVDFLNPDGDFVGVFMAGAGSFIENERCRIEDGGDSYRALLFQTLADRLAEASSEYLHYFTRKEIWGYSPDEPMDVERILRGDYRGIRPAMGYPMLPDQLLNREVFKLLQPESGKHVSVTENGAMSPSATVSGLYISHPDSRYFTLPVIETDQISDYASRRGLSVDRVKEILNR